MNKTMRKIAIITAAVGILFAPLSFAKTESLDGIAAVVDNDVVLLSELNTRLDAVRTNLERAGRDLPPAQELRTAILNQMIVESIQLQRGENAGVRISEEQIDDSMARIAQQQGVSFDVFRSQLFAEGSYYAVREQIRREMIINQVQMGSLSRQVSITPEELDAFLASPEGQELSEARYQVLQIMIPLSDSASSAEKTNANRILNEARNTLSNQGSIQAWISQNQQYVQAKNLGWRTMEQLPSLYVDAVSGLAIGEVSGVMTASNGLHIVQLLDASNKATMIDQYKSRHILIKTSALINDVKAQQLARDFKAKVEAGADFAELAKEHSEDIGSAAEGGDLGWSEPGQFVPEFESTLATLKLGEVSEPFKSQFGWHIILLEDKKRTDMSDRVLQNRAYSVLRERKFDDVRDEWLQQLRDTAYVDIK